MTKKKNRFLQKTFFWLLIIFGLYIIINKTMEIIIHSKKEVIVPNIEGKSVADALEIVSKIGLGLKKIGETYNPNLPAGTVLSQQPPGGMVVREGRYVNVIISLGGEKIFVPNIVGEEKRKAEIILRQYGLIVGTVTENYSLRYLKNKVISQLPVEGSVVDRNSTVDFIISGGFPPDDIILVPEFVNRHIDEVIRWSQKYGIQVITKETFSNQSKTGFVIDQNPLPDVEITKQNILEVTVAKADSQSLVSTMQNENNFVYELPPMGRVSKKVKIVQISADGEQVLYNQMTLPGTKITLNVPPKNNAKIRIFVDGVFIDEK